MTQPQEDDWTYVAPKKGRRRIQPESPSSKNSFQIDREATADSLRAELEIYRARWLASDSRKSIHQAIQQLYVHERKPITQAVCMAVGQFGIINLELRGRSILQLVVFMDIAKHLEDLLHTTIVLYAQEPSLRDTDKKFLTSLNIGILEHDVIRAPDEEYNIGPAAAYMNENTLVADFFLNYNIGQQLADHDIGLVISAIPSRLEGPVEMSYVGEGYKEAWLRKYRWYAFSRIEFDEQALHGLYICALREKEDAE